MRRLLFSLFALAALCGGACAQFSVLPGFPPGVFQDRGALDGGGGSPPPTLTYISTGGLTNTSPTQTASISYSAPGAPLMFVMAVQNNENIAISGVTVAPNVGSTVTGSVVSASQCSTAAESVILYAITLSDADTSTSATITITYGTTVFAAGYISVWSVPSASLSSTTPTGSNCNEALATAVSTTVATTAGGFVVASAQNQNITSNSGAISGTEAYTTDENAELGFILQLAAGHANGVGTNASSTVTATYTASGINQISAAAWR